MLGGTALGANDALALRQLAYGSTAIAEAAIVRLMQLKLVQRHGHDYRLTPLGQRTLHALPKPALHVPDQGDPIAAVLDKYEERFRTVRKAAPPRIETRGRPTRQMAEEAAMSPVIFFDSHHALESARLRIAAVRERRRRQAHEDKSRAASSAAAIAQSLAALSASSKHLQALSG
jgi:hypothetical protein